MKKYFLLVVLININIIASAQVQNQIIAKVGKTSISVSEFKERFELTPWPRSETGKLSANPQTDFLYTLVAEKLLAQKARDLGYDSSAAVNSAFKTIEKMYARDALYKHEISSKVNLTAAEIDAAVGKNRYRLSLDCLRSSDEKGIQALLRALKKGVPFDSLLENNAALQKDSLLEVSFGDLDSDLEEILYKLNPGRYTTAPVSTPYGWYIFRLVKSVDRYSLGVKEREKVLTEARKIARERAANIYYRNFYKKFFSERKTDADGYLFWSFADKVIKLLKEKQQDPKIPAKEKIYLTSADFLKIEKEFGPDSLSLSFINLDNNPITLKQFIGEVAFEGFFSNTVEPRIVRARLDSRVKYYIENELLARESLKMGLQNLPDVKRSLQMWRDSFLAQLMKSKLVDSLRTAAADSNLPKELKKDMPSGLTMVNIVEILTDSLETVEKILDELKNNKDIRELARKYTKREWTKEKGGEFGLFPESSYGEIGRIAGKMNVGDVYGPLKTEDGYSVFKLIDKKKEDPASEGVNSTKGSASADDQLSRKFLEKLTGYTASLAKSYGVKINEKVLNSVGAINLNIFAYRYMGFGGRLMAVPLTVPFTEWVQPWLKGRQDMP